MSQKAKEIVSFRDRASFRKWLEANHGSSPGVWLSISKGSKPASLSANDALEEALCFGWIDSIIKGVDESRYLKYFAPRRKESAWSDRNKKTAGKLIASGLMTAAGLAAVKRSKENGKWDEPKAAFDFEPLIRHLEALLKPHPAELAKFGQRPASTKRQWAASYFSAKQDDTRRKRLEKIIGALRSDQKGLLF